METPVEFRRMLESQYDDVMATAAAAAAEQGARRAAAGKPVRAAKMAARERNHQTFWSL
jgi:hypothetical protein